MVPFSARISTATVSRSGDLPILERRRTNSPVTLGEEVLVVDARAHLTPSQIVESKLIGLLKGSSLPVSSLHLTGRLLRR